MPLFNVKSPGKVNAFNNFFVEMATFNFIDADEIAKENFYAPELEPISLNF